MSFIDKLKFCISLMYNDSSIEMYENLPRPRLKRTVFVCDGEWLPLISVECEV